MLHCFHVSLWLNIIWCDKNVTVMNLEGYSFPRFSSLEKACDRSDSDWLPVGWAHMRKWRLTFLEVNGKSLQQDMWASVSHTCVPLLSAPSYNHESCSKDLKKNSFSSASIRNLVSVWNGRMLVKKKKRRRQREMFIPSPVNTNVLLFSRRLISIHNEAVIFLIMIHSLQVFINSPGMCKDINKDPWIFFTHVISADPGSDSWGSTCN